MLDHVTYECQINMCFEIKEMHRKMGKEQKTSAFKADK